jgi:mRNA interferase MazF
VVVAVPISNTTSAFPAYVPLDERTQTQGKILCDHIRTLDLESRGYKLIETLPSDIMETVVAMIGAIIEVEG